MRSRDDLYCRVCGYENVEPPWGSDGRCPNYDFCPCCGVEWGYGDFSPTSVRRFRDSWLRGGATWDDAGIEHDGLVVGERLKRIGYELPVTGIELGRTDEAEAVERLGRSEASGFAVREGERRRWLRYEQEHGYIRARLRLLATHEGGRTRPIFTGYRAHWWFEPEVHPDSHDAPLLIEGSGMLELGAEALIRLHPTCPEGWPEPTPGLQLKMMEGAQVVGLAEVVEVVGPLVD
ncbi:hypothetical protein [Occultella kanbiaonis]|uniref:hypothetical protein n=1 Tax=Occultella kanbiaonis TaxID=2675754 RepID=UPI0012B93563|nr:hypothetical protein [Occultella kanbiaonis]